MRLTAGCDEVAPRAGARIETDRRRSAQRAIVRRSPRGSADRNSECHQPIAGQPAVAPRAGARIETANVVADTPEAVQSLPARERGSKQRR